MMQKLGEIVDLTPKCMMYLRLLILLKTSRPARLLKKYVTVTHFAIGQSNYVIAKWFWAFYVHPFAVLLFSGYALTKPFKRKVIQGVPIKTLP